MATKKKTDDTGSAQVTTENGLAYIQARLKAPKSQFNRFGGYRYRSCEDILEAVKPLLAECRCTLTISDDVVEIGGRIYVKATATLTDELGVMWQTSAYAREPEQHKGSDAAQITGASSSYARKYALNGLFCIDDTKDADYLNTTADNSKAGNGSGATAACGKTTTAVATPAQQRDIPALVAGCTTGAQLLSLFNTLTPAEQQAHKALFSNRKKQIA